MAVADLRVGADDRAAWLGDQEDPSITLVTPEDAPLAIIGKAVSEAVERLLEASGILMITSAHCETREPGQVSIDPDSRRLHVDRVIALPELFGPSTPGEPTRTANGFIPIDTPCQVPGLERVFAAGDAADFAVKHAGIAAQQADAAAEAIAALARAPIEPTNHYERVRRARRVGPVVVGRVGLLRDLSGS